MNTFSYVPPGFRFHPTDEELVDYYLRKKVASKKIDLDVIKDVDLYKIEPWDLQEKCKIGSEEQSEWYFFSHKDKKYPTGTRTNRATAAGFWKATGRDKPIHVKHCLVGMRKTLVYYKGRAPNGHKSDWIMHEYRLETNEHGTTHHEEGWVVCRVFKKRVAMTMVRRTADESPCWFDNHVGFMPELDTSIAYHKPELEYHQLLPQGPFLQLPQLESPKHPTYLGHGATTLQPSTLTHDETARCTAAPQPSIESVYLTTGEASVMDWRTLDKFVASQLSHGEATLKESTYSNLGLVLQIDKQEEGLDYTSTSASIGGENKMWN